MSKKASTMSKVRRVIIDKVEDDKLARAILLELQIIELEVSDREQILEERLNRLGAGQ